MQKSVMYWGRQDTPKYYNRFISKLDSYLLKFGKSPCCDAPYKIRHESGSSTFGLRCTACDACANFFVPQPEERKGMMVVLRQVKDKFANIQAEKVARALKGEKSWNPHFHL